MRYRAFIIYIYIIEIILSISWIQKIEQNASKRPIVENIEENEFESSDDEDYMRELNKAFEAFGSDDEYESEDNIPEVPVRRERENRIQDLWRLP